MTLSPVCPHTPPDPCHSEASTAFVLLLIHMVQKLHSVCFDSQTTRSWTWVISLWFLLIIFLSGQKTKLHFSRTLRRGIWVSIRPPLSHPIVSIVAVSPLLHAVHGRGDAVADTFTCGEEPNALCLLASQATISTGSLFWTISCLQALDFGSSVWDFLTVCAAGVHLSCSHLPYLQPHACHQRNTL